MNEEILKDFYYSKEKGVGIFTGTYKREGEKRKRNESCYCGSGKKYKKCCLCK